MMGVGHVGLVEDRCGTDATGHDNHHGYGDRTVPAALSSPPRRAGRTPWQLEEGLYLLTEALTAFEVSGRSVSAPRRAPAAAVSPREAKPKPTSSRPWQSPVASKLNPESFGLPRVYAGCGTTTARVMALASCWSPSTAGSPRAWTPPTSRRSKGYWMSCHNGAPCHCSGSERESMGMAVGIPGGTGKAERDAGVLTIMSCSWVHPERASRCWPAGSPLSCRR
jgi:hypothetical protein